MKYSKNPKIFLSLIKRVTAETICLSTKYKGGNYSTLKLRGRGGGGNKTTPNMEGKSTFFHFIFVGKTICFFTINNVLKKKSQPRNTVRKSVKL